VTRFYSLLREVLTCNRGTRPSCGRDI